MLCTVTALLTACPSGSNGDGGGSDGGSSELVAPKLEVTAGTGHLQGGQFTLDIQIGHPTRQQRMGSGSTQLDPRSAVKP